MASEIYQEIQEGVRVEEEARLVYTQKAYQLLPTGKTPRILDIGCGRGEVTLELARLSGGEVVGFDIDQTSLDELKNKIAEKGWSDRVTVVNQSMRSMDFRERSFDILWSEGSIFVVGFQQGLMAWKRFIRQSGFLVVHEMTWLEEDPPQEIRDHWVRIYPGIGTTSENLQIIRDCGYELIELFSVPEEVWWHDYYGPREMLIPKLREKYSADEEAMRVLDREQHEVDMYRKYSKWYGSAFYVMRKPANAD